MPALKPDHDIGAAGKPVDNLAFAFIAPLRTNNGDVRHFICSMSEGNCGHARMGERLARPA
jgi:hypothetical protein